jgi:hypothetical protein
MPKRVLEVSENEVLDNTRHSIISSFIANAKTIINNKNFIVYNTYYKVTENYDTVEVAYNLGSYGFVNNLFLICTVSNIKSYKFKAIIKCDNLTFGSSSKVFRKNLTVNDSLDMIGTLLLNVPNEVGALKNFNYALDIKKITKKEISEIVGHLYFHEEILTSSQISLLKKEYNLSSRINTYLDFYNKISIVLELSHPNSYMNNHYILSNFFLNKILDSYPNAETVSVEPQEIAVQKEEEVLFGVNFL